MRRRYQQGFSLVELMVALVLGTLIVAAAVQMFITNQRTFQLQQNMSAVQESGRFALEFIEEDLRQAGLSRADGAASSGVTIFSGYEGGAGASANDQLVFDFYGTMDCEGDVYTKPSATAPDVVLIKNYYYVNAGNLMCRGEINGVADADGVTLVSNVDSFQVLYGVDRPMVAGEPQNDGIPFAGRYMTAAELAAASSNIIVSVRVGLLVRADRDSSQQSGTPKGFTVLDKTLAGGTAPLDKQAVRRLFITTVKLRNYNWESV